MSALDEINRLGFRVNIFQDQYVSTLWHATAYCPSKKGTSEGKFFCQADGPSIASVMELLLIECQKPPVEYAPAPRVLREPIYRQPPTLEDLA